MHIYLGHGREGEEDRGEGDEKTQMRVKLGTFLRKSGQKVTKPCREDWGR